MGTVAYRPSNREPSVRMAELDTDGPTGTFVDAPGTVAW
jgi:hypothetical protein